MPNLRFLDSEVELLELYLRGAQRDQRLRIAGVELHRPLQDLGPALQISDIGKRTTGIAEDLRKS